MHYKAKYDLIVAGGGFSGCAAAIAAARQNLSVLLIEQSGYLGGAACNCFVNPFMPYTVRWNDETRNLSEGIFSQILHELNLRGGLHTNHCTFNEEILKLVLDDMTTQAGVEVLFHTVVTGAETQNGKITGVCVSGKSGPMTFSAETFVDATGDGDLAVLSGCRFQIGREKDHLCQPMTLCFRIANVDTELYWENRLEIIKLYQQFRSQGQIQNPREDVLAFRHMAKGVLHLNSTRIVQKNPVDVFDLSKAEKEARKQAFELYQFLKENCDGFQNSVLLSSAPSIGVRESRKILGEYTLTVEDLKACTKFEDGIASCNYDIDIHNPEGTGTSHYYFAPGTYYTIPYRCLLAKDLSNLLVAGRCISSTHEAQASYRIMPVCCALGEAAGTAAAIAARSGVSIKNADIRQIRSTLIENGAFL